mmetsp:Transcript_27773/g.70797  ORF Transcript_27773/g.70797 Transcript_27773/m.70797 type:complete len:302 (-) Transcript_27773:1088-1993(-)
MAVPSIRHAQRTCHHHLDQHQQCISASGSAIMSWCGPSLGGGGALGGRPLGQRGRTKAGGQARLLIPHGAGNVQVRPLHLLLDELLEEQRSRDGAASAAARVLHVGAGALQLVKVTALKGHTPHLLARSLGRLLHRGSGRVGGREEARDVVAQRDDARARQRGGVHDGGGPALLLSEPQRVSQRQAALRVRVVHLHRLAAGAGQHIAGPQALASHHVLARGDDEVDLCASGLHGAHDARSTQGGRSTAHVKLHQLNHRARAGLQVVAAGVERESLAHHGHLLVGRPALGRVGQVDEARRLL